MKTLNFIRFLLVAGLLLAETTRATTLQLRVDPPGAPNEYRPQPVLEWDGVPGATYVVQTATNLAGPEAWKAVDAVESQAGTSSWWGALESWSGSKYFRLVTQPLISDVQPAFIDSDDTNAVLYILGQLLPTNATVIINGQNFTPTVINSNGVWATVSLNGLPPGTSLTGTIYVVDNATGATNSQYKLKAGFLFATDPSPQLLQGPPTEPPASPQALIAIWASRKGYQYYQAQSDMASAGAVNNPFFTENQGQGAMAGRAGKIKPLRVTCERGQVNDPASRSGQAEPGPSVKKELMNLSRIQPDSGELQCEETDLVIPGRGLDFAWTRTYRSRTGPVTAQGAGWDFSFNVSLAQNGDGTVTLRPGNGREDIFYPDGTNGWVRDEYFCEIRDLNSDGFPDVIFADTGRWIFRPANAMDPAGGKLAQIIDRNGNTVTLDYDTAGRLTTIVDDLGRTNTVAYNTAGQITGVADFTGRMVHFEYNTAGDLVSVISPPVVGTPTGNDFPGGITNRYLYSSGHADDRLNHNLIACVDGKGQTTVEFIYSPTNDPASMDFDTVITTQRGIEKKQIKRGMVILKPASRFAAVKAILCDGVGNVSEAFYDSRGRCVTLREYTGRSNPELPVTDTENRPSGKLRAEDPEYFETQWTWNPDSLCKSVLHVSRPDMNPDTGLNLRYTYERDFNSAASARKKGDCRVVRLLAEPGGGADLDGDGVNDISELAWHFDYDPRFGSSANIRTRIKELEAILKNTGILARTIKRFGFGGETAPASLLGKINNGTKWEKVDNSELDLAAAVGNVGINEKTPDTFLNNLRTRLDELESRLKAFGLLARSGNGIKDFQVGEVCDDGNTDSGEGFVTSATNPRGGTITSDYDAKGNLIKVRAQQCTANATFTDGAPGDFAYNPHGQPIAITNMPDANGYRRVDTFSYYTNGPQAGQLQSFVIDDRGLIGLREYHAFEYDAVGNLTRYVDPRTNDWLFTYNALDWCIRVQTPVNKTARTTKFAVLDASGNLTDSGMELRDANDVFIRNVTTHYDYDAFNRCTAVVQPVEPGVFITNRFEYDANDNLVANLSPLAVSGEDPHALTQFEYDERGLLFREIAAPGSPLQNTDQLDYDANGNVTRVSEGLEGTPSITMMEYDGFGGGDVREMRKARAKKRPLLPDPKFSASAVVTKITDPMGNETCFNYDRNGNCTLIRFYGETNDVPGGAGNILLAKSTYKYDGRDRAVECITSHFRTSGAPMSDGAAVTTFAYAPNGACTNIIDDNGHATTYDYDAAGRVYLVKTPRTVVQAHRNASGNVTSLIQTDTPDGGGPPQQFSVSYSYDSLGRCTNASDNVGNTSGYAYDSLGRLVRETDPRGVATVVEYDDLGYTTKLWVDQNADGNIASNELVQTRTRNVPRLIIVMTDGNANSTRYGYDRLGNCTSITNADNTVQKLIWSPRSNLVGIEDPNGTVVTNIYDLNNRLIHRDIAVGSGVAATTTFENFAYDGAGRCVRAENNSCTNSFEFDSLGNCVGSKQNGKTTLAEIGPRSTVSLIYPSDRVVSYALNPAYDITNITVTVGTTITSLASFTYDGPGRPRSVSYHNGVSTAIKRSGQVGVPNAPGDFGWQQVVGLAHSTVMGPFWTGTNKWDAAQNNTARNNFQLGSLAVEDTIDFVIDGDNRLIQSLRTTNGILARSVNYVLDINGNRQLVEDNGLPQIYSMTATIPPGDFQMDRYSETPFGSQVFDLNGNLIARVSTTAQTFYEYDYANRLVSVAAFDSGSGSVVPVADYAYDAFGRRIRKTVPSSSAMLPPVVTEYVQSLNLQRFGGDILMHGSDDIAETYVDGALLDSFVHKLDDGVTVMRARNGGPSVFYHSDDLGNTVALTDGGGAVIERYIYDDFGLPHFLDGNGEIIATNGSPAGNLFLFGGMEWDAETGLNYHQNPLYDGPRNMANNPLYEDPKTGRATRGKVKNVKDMGGSAFEGNAFLLKKEEGGRHTPFHNKYRPQFSSAKIPRSILKSYFETGDKPTQDQFSSPIDSKVICPGGGRIWPHAGY